MHQSESIEQLDRLKINAKSHRILTRILNENPQLKDILSTSDSIDEVNRRIREWVLDTLDSNGPAIAYYNGTLNGRDVFEQLEWSDYAAIRILDYIDHAGSIFEDLNLRGALSISNPFRFMWLAARHGVSGAEPAFFIDMLHLLRQFNGTSVRRLPTRREVIHWMHRHPSGLDRRIQGIREQNRDRILRLIIRKIDEGQLSSTVFKFKPGQTPDQKYQTALHWWNMKNFHLSFAIRDPDMLNEMLGFSLSPETMSVLHRARDAGIPFFVNPYYLSLLNVREPDFAVGADLGIRAYIFYSRELIEEFGHIVAWEKEDEVEPGKPNAAGWILPTRTNIHRRYPEVAILIPDTVGRACGGLCSSCQRMYDFQRGNLNFKLEKLRPTKSWPEKLQALMDYFEQDSQLRDILITGGDALMSSDQSLKRILDAVYEMARRKKAANRKRPDGEKYAEMLRIRLGTRLLVYLPMRVTNDLRNILSDFRDKARKIGFRQFIIQTHFESPMEITPEVKTAVEKILSAGWMITNQHVFTAASSRRGHTARLRQVLNEIGVLPYYTFTVKGYMENYDNFVPNARAVQEQIEEKSYGQIPALFGGKIRELNADPGNISSRIDDLRRFARLPFLATDRNVLNLPGVGKSLTFRVIGITRYGRRILEFDHDHTRSHSPIIEKMGKVIIIESKSISNYLHQLDEMGEEVAEYEDVFGYSLGETETLTPVFQYPAYQFQLTGEKTNLDLSAQTQ